MCSIGAATVTLATPAAATSPDDEQRALEQLLLDSVRGAHFEQVVDYGPIEGLCPAGSGCPETAPTIAATPNVDVAVIELDDKGRAVAAANVLLSRDHPDGIVVPIDLDRGPAGSYGVSSVRWRRWDMARFDGGTFDEETGQRVTTMAWDAPYSPADDLLAGREQAAVSFLSPYPASLFKVIVAFRIMRLVDMKQLSLNDRVPPPPAPAAATPSTTAPLPTTGSATPAPPTGSAPATPTTEPASPALTPQRAERADRTDAAQATVHAGRIGETPGQRVRDAMFAMMTYSDNESARGLLRLLHQRNDLPAMHAELRELGLGTLQINGTNPATGGNWQPGSISMTSMDTARLLWLIEQDSGELWTRPDGKAVQASLLSPKSRAYLQGLLADQAYQEALATTIFCGKEGVRPGIPATEPRRWINPSDGTVTVDGYFYGNDVRPCNAAAEVTFDHKTGLTWNYGADAGIVQQLKGKPERHYVISFISNLGYRYVDSSFANRRSTPCEDPVSPICFAQQIPTMAQQIDAGLRDR